MANDLLKQIKDLDYTHDEVIDILKNYKESEGKPKDEPEDNTDYEEPNEPERKPNNEIKDIKEPIDIKTLSNEITNAVSKNLTETIGETVSKEIQKQLKKIRNSPPQGTLSDERGGNSSIIKKNLYETWV